MNIQSTIIKCISQQLFLNNYLVMPNFGGFVLKTTSAQLALNGAVIIPPTKTITFNAQLKQNDGVLAICLQNTLNCSITEALNHLNDFALYCKSILNTSKRITFENIGFFYTDFENNICFEPQTNTNYLMDSFGLTPLTLKKLLPEIEKITLKKQPVFIDKKPEKVIQEPILKRKNYSKILVPSIVTITLFSLLALIVSNTKITGNLKATLLGTTTKINYNPIPYPDLKLQTLNNNNTYVADANGLATLILNTEKTLFVNVNSTLATSKILAITTKKTNATSVHNINLTSNTSSYKIVLGCFSIAQNAKRLVTNLKKNNITAIINNKNIKGLYVVSTGNFNNKQAAAEQLAQLATNYPGAWIKNPD